MATEKQMDLIDRNALKKYINENNPYAGLPMAAHICTMELLDYAPTVDAVEVEDKKLLKAIKMLIKQYDHSKQSEYVHSPVAHALFHTWKKVDGEVNGNRKTAD